VIDLEALARHRGSVFGAINHPSTGASSSEEVNDSVDAPYRQPTCEQMENALAVEWAALDPNRAVWLEDESRAIGAVRVPDAVFAQVRINYSVASSMLQKRHKQC
jgi:tRNA 2-selenouridine synthase